MGPHGGVDRDTLLARMGGDRELLHEVIAIFLTQVPQLLSALHAAAAAGDGDAVQRAAHSFKGSIVVFEAGAALAAVSDVERAGRAGDLTAATRAIASLERAILPLCSDLVEITS